MNFKTIFAVISLSTVALGKAIKTSYITIPTEYGNVPRELMGLFDYEIGDEMGAGINAKTCIVSNYQRYCNEDITSDKVDKSKLKDMKKHFDMGGKSQKEMCKIIKETCNMINSNYNPYTGEALSMADLYTLNGEKIPKDLLGYFNYRVNGDGEDEMVINGNSRTIFYLYQDVCGEDIGSIEKEKESYAKEKFPDYTQEKICEIIKDTYGMISYNYNPLTGEGRNLEDFIPKELAYLFDYEIGDEMGAGINGKTCLVHNYQKYCNEDITSDKVDKSKLKDMKKHFDMGGKSQKEMCKIIKETCNMINSNYNPYTGEALSMADLYTLNGEKIPKDLLGYFNYRVNGDGEDEMVINGNSRTIFYLYQDVCGEDIGSIEKEKESYAKEKFPDYTQEKICEIIKDTYGMISYNYNPLTGEGKNRSIYIKA